MKKLIALIMAVGSGLYLAFGWAPDPIPFIDEGAAFLVFINCLAFLGLDLKRFFGLKGKKSDTKAQTIDVE